MKILHLPLSTGGNSSGLAKGEKKIGLDSTVLVREREWLDYQFDISLNWEKKNNFQRVLESFKAFYKYRNKYDVFHFNYGTTLIDYPKYNISLLDLPFYPEGKKIIFTYNGCDARQKYKTINRVEYSACHQGQCNKGICLNGKRDKLKEKRIEKVNKYADHIFSLNPDLMWFLPKNKTSFLPYTVARWYKIKPQKYSIEKKIKIVHAPTSRNVKGSKFIIKALENLKKKHRNIEIILVENVPNKKAFSLYKQANLVIDQILVGWYGAFAVETMKMGKPVAAFIREDDLKFIEPEMRDQVLKTLININKFNIEDKLEQYIENQHLLTEKSKACLDYVNKWHNPEYVAAITKRVYENT
ncbi:MAG: hypothetical protein APR63_11260 [Desulfuromonas sp. SDB]|nr:MAG: hypothetical protein APR63_11260 [Desulfuromonas sp. SDB]